MRSGSEALLDTDVFSQHLTAGQEDSVLLRCAESFDNCYTSVINIAEVLSGCRSKHQKERAKQAFYGIGLLGIPFRYSERLADILKAVKTDPRNSYRDAILIMMCSETKLPLVTFQSKRYATLSKKFGVKVIEGKKIRDSVIKQNIPE